MSDKAILVGKEVTPVSDLREWGKWFEENQDKKRIAYDVVNGSRVSTVFLGLNHSWGDGPDLWFETMVFDGPLDGEQDRYSTYEQAERGHKRMVEKVAEYNKAERT